MKQWSRARWGLPTLVLAVATGLALMPPEAPPLASEGGGDPPSLEPAWERTLDCVPDDASVELGDRSSLLLRSGGRVRKLDSTDGAVLWEAEEPSSEYAGGTWRGPRYLRACEDPQTFVCLSVLGWQEGALGSETILADEPKRSGARRFLRYLNDSEYELEHPSRSARGGGVQAAWSAECAPTHQEMLACRRCPTHEWNCSSDAARLRNKG
jgi:hypothetical protein